MTKDDIFLQLKNIIIEILPDILPEQIKIEESLRNLGANSIDRMDIVIKAMEDLKIKIPLVEFGMVNNLQGLVDLLYSRKVS